MNEEQMRFIQDFWEYPEQALKDLIQEMVRKHASRRGLAKEVERRSQKRYPDQRLPLSSITFWISWGLDKPKATRVPQFENGVRLFRILLEIKNEQDTRAKRFRTP